MSYRYESKCGNVRLLKSYIHSEMTRTDSLHTVEISFAALTRAQAEALQVALLRYLGTLDFKAKL